MRTYLKILVALLLSMAAAFAPPAGESSAAGTTAEVEAFLASIDECSALYAQSGPAAALPPLEQLLAKAKKTGQKEYLKVLTYIMRLQYELGDLKEGEKTRERIDREVSKVKDPEYLKNLYMARASIFANARKMDGARNDIRLSLKHSESMENLLTAAMIAARFKNRDEAYKMLDRAFTKKDDASETLEALIMKNLTAAIICIGLEDIDEARAYIDFVVENLHKTVDKSYFTYIYKSLIHNIFSFFELNPSNLEYYEKIRKAALERGDRRTAGETGITIAAMLSSLGSPKSATKVLDEAAAELEMEKVRIDADLSYDTLEQMNRMAAVLSKCDDHARAARIYEDSIMAYEKKGNLKDSFDKIRKLAYEKFRLCQPVWRPLIEELIRTTDETHETLELCLTRNAYAEMLLETGEAGLAYKVFDMVFESIDSKKPGEFPQSEFAEIYFRTVRNLVRVALAEKNTAKALKLIDRFSGLYERYRDSEDEKRARRKRSSDSLSSFVVQIEFAVSAIATTIGGLKLEKARILKAAGDAGEAARSAAEAAALLKNGESLPEYREALEIACSSGEILKSPAGKKFSTDLTRMNDIRKRFPE